MGLNRWDRQDRYSHMIILYDSYRCKHISFDFQTGEACFSIDCSSTRVFSRKVFGDEMLQVATNPLLLLTLPWLYPGFLEHQFSGSLEHQCGESLQQHCGEIHWRPPSFQLLFPRQRCCCFRDNGTKNKPIRARQGAASKEINWILRVSEAIQDLAR